jgi:hypothetical protein
MLARDQRLLALSAAVVSALACLLALAGGVAGLTAARRRSA